MKMPPLRQTRSTPPTTIAPVNRTAIHAASPSAALPLQAKPSFHGLSYELQNNLQNPSPKLSNSVGGGRKLPEAVQQKMEAAFNADFSDVRIHEGGAPEALGAIAYTQGADIHFAPGEYRPMQPQGYQLLGHELAHVVQQRAGRVSAQSPINTDAHLEAEADAMAARASNGMNRVNGGDSNSMSPAPTQAAPIQLMKKKLTDKKIDHSGRNVDNIAGGAINEVDLVTYNKPIGNHSRTGFFKADVTNGGAIGEAAEDLGIDRNAPQLANRAVASSQMAALLQNKQGHGPGNVIAKTVFARHRQQEGTVSEAASGKALKTGVAVLADDQQQIKLMRGRNYNDLEQRDLYFGGGGIKYRPGNDKKKLHVTQKLNPQGPDELENPNEFYKEDVYQYYHKFNFKKAETQKGLMDLQLMDALTGQVDRHGSNIFIEPQTGKVTGIDNDAAFGSQNSADPIDLVARTLPQWHMRASHNQGLPPLVDHHSAQMVLALQPKAVRKELKDLLSHDEIENTISRLNLVQQHIQNLYRTGKVVGSPNTTNALGQPVNHPFFWNNTTYNMAMQLGANTSYLERSVTHYDQAAQQGPQYAEGASIPQPVLPQVVVNVNNPPQAIVNQPVVNQPVVNQPVVNLPQPTIAPPQENGKPLRPGRKLTPEERIAALKKDEEKFKSGSEMTDWQTMQKRENAAWRLDQKQKKEQPQKVVAEPIESHLVEKPPMVPKTVNVNRTNQPRVLPPLSIQGNANLAVNPPEVAPKPSQPSNLPVKKQPPILPPRTGNVQPGNPQSSVAARIQQLNLQSTNQPPIGMLPPELWQQRRRPPT
jgi:Domain of unknown function (DUF4157)